MAGMTRKHFEAIAQAMRDNKPEQIFPENHEYNREFRFWEKCVKALAEALKTTNPQFDKERFISLCKTVPHGG